VAARKRTTSRAAVLPAVAAPPALRRLAPSGRSLLVGFGLLFAAAGVFAAARETSLFAVRHIDVVGGSARARAEVRAALAGEVGRSLLKVGGDELDARVANAPDVVAISFDRSFPHTLRVVVRAERPVLLVRRGPQAWLVSGRGRVLREVKDPRRSSLPRAWVARETTIAVGDRLAPEQGGRAAAALAAVRPPLAGRIRFVRADRSELTFVLRNGLELRLGEIADIRVKLAIARRILALIGPGTTGGYLDVSVPERPVLGSSNSPVAG
jgi:cell division protein FtsQ